MNKQYALVLVLLVLPAVHSLYGSKSNVVPLSKKNFVDNVISSEHLWVVEFFAPWCGHCKQLAPEYDKAATNLKAIVRVGAVDCDVEKELCGSFDIKGFPTIKIFPSKATPVPKKDGAFQKVPEDYQGQRTAAAIVNYALSKMPSFVSPVTSSNYEKFLSESLPKAILFTNKDKTSDLYKALSVDLHHRMVLGEARHTDKKLIEKYGIANFPTLLVLPKEEGGEPTKFDGKLSHDSLTKFLEPFAGPMPEKSKSGSKSKESKESKERKEPEPEPETGEIYEVKDQVTFDTQCVNKGGLCAVAFLDYVNFEQAEVDRYISILKALGEKFKGKLRILYLDGPSQSDCIKVLDLSANYPNAVVLSPKKLRYTPFLGAFTEESLSDFFDAVLRGKRSFAIDKLPSITAFTKPSTEPVREPETELKEEL